MERYHILWLVAYDQPTIYTKGNGSGMVRRLGSSVFGRCTEGLAFWKNRPGTLKLMPGGVGVGGRMQPTHPDSSFLWGSLQTSMLLS
jgi:hypothetical protein